MAKGKVNELTFEDRRLALGMPVPCLAKRSGLAEGTVRRILRGDHLKPGTRIRVRSLLAVAEALGMELHIEDSAVALRTALERARNELAMARKDYRIRCECGILYYGKCPVCSGG
ncbi:hypothetical protein AYO40_03550 [Planctomycetaceae bacterium SCGC AG-212-D15]|nr:hypothetical protein AYO40_03550 [Planctomycetaceae bacterium SCGC AG-212-D15]